MEKIGQTIEDKREDHKRYLERQKSKGMMRTGSMIPEKYKELMNKIAGILRSNNKEKIKALKDLIKE